MKIWLQGVRTVIFGRFFIFNRNLKMKEKNYEKVILTIFLLIFGFSSSLGVLAADASLEDVEWQEENNNDPEIRYHDYRAIGEGYMDGWYIHDFTTLYRNY